MSNILRHPIDAVGSLTAFNTHSDFLARRPLGRRGSWRSAALCALAFGLTCKVHAQDQATTPAQPPASTTQRCLPDDSGYLQARLKGSIDAELDWRNDDTECIGAVRPTDGGIRMRFTHRAGPDGKPDESLVLVFGIAGLHEGQGAKTLPVNVTVIREGTGEFYGTQGDDKCTLDEITQTPLVGIPNRSRSYRVVARGFCTEPARAVRGKGAVLISRFDYAGRVDFGTEATEPDPRPDSGAPDTSLKAKTK
ncbi:MAG TPA: hypothetical protein VNQ81_16835 [Povalibacter sp.]|nr:hypothetical protein [Povalibacter sp.]